MNASASPATPVGASGTCATAPPTKCNSLISIWNRCWFEPARPEPLAAFRILFGIYLLCYLGGFAEKVTLAFSNQGVVQPWLLPDWLIPSPTVAVFLYACLLLLILLFILGCTTLLTTPVLLLFYAYFFLLNLAVKDSAYDRLNLIFLLISCFAELDATWSLAPTFVQRSDQIKFINPWAARLIGLQLCLLYLGSGLWKLDSPQWHENQMMYWTLIGPWASGLSFWFVNLGWPMWFYGLIGWGTIVFELTAPLTFHLQSTRKLAIIVGTLFHVSIAVFLNIPEFFNCIAAYALFWPPEELAKLGEKIARLVGKTPCVQNSPDAA